MAKLKPVSNDELSDLTFHLADDLIFIMQDISLRLEKGSCEDFGEGGVVSHVRTLTSLIRTAAELSNLLMINQSSQELKNEVDRLRRVS